MKYSAILLLTFTLSTIAWSQNVTSKKTAINGATVATKNNGTDLPIFTTSADAEKIVSSIMAAMGLESDFKIKEAHVPNVEAKIRHRERYILYNPQFINQVNTVTQNKWACIFILAHEVGHHLEGHTLADIGSRLAVELQADEFAGFILYKMGATLRQAQLAMYYIANADASKTHPARADRLAAIERGWNKAEFHIAGITDPNVSQTSSGQN